MNSASLIKVLYGLMGIVLLIAGAAVILATHDLMGQQVKDVVLKIARNDSNSIHLAQELGSVFIFAALMSFYFLKNYSQSRFYHWAMVVFFALFALVHWFDVRGPLKSYIEVIINGIPFGLYLIAGFFRLGK